jgi:hypothetical protein
VDYSASPETVDFDEPQMLPGVDEREYRISRQFVYLTNIARNIRGTVKIYAHLRKKKEDWSLDPDFIAHDDEYEKWMRRVPADLQVVFPQDGSSPWLPSPFVGNMHCYYYLSKIMHHRPQIHYLMEHSSGMSWKPSMMLCLDAAQKMCRIQESMLHNHGFAGLMCMQRGMSFTIYSVLTCTMLHLVRCHLLAYVCGTDPLGCHYLSSPRS